MRNDHRLVFPVSYERGADPVYPLGVPVRIADQLREQAIEPAETPDMLAVGDVVMGRAGWVSSYGQRAMVVSVSQTGSTVRLHFERDAQPDPSLYVAFAFERVTQ